MKSFLSLVFVIILFLSLNSCKQDTKHYDVNILFLHHSTGQVIWTGKKNSILVRILQRISSKFPAGELPSLFNKYNREHNYNYKIEELSFPKSSLYGWKNFPYDYYNIWVKNEGDQPFMDEPTLEILTKKYNVIIFKHCFPVSNIQPDTELSDINSEIKTISNYQLQYSALREKLHQFPDTKFILFTGAVQVKKKMSEAEAIKSKEFFNWVVDEWDIESDNVYLWDLYNLQTEGGLFFLDEYAISQNNSHPNEEFATKAANLLFNRIIDVIERDGRGTLLNGEKKIIRPTK